MKQRLTAALIAALLLFAGPLTALAEETYPGASVDELLALLKERNPDYASMRHEASAAIERVEPAGALMAPRFKVEWDDITRGGEQIPTVLPSEVGSTRYTLSQDVPWSGKRNLKREIAAHDVEAAQGRLKQTLAEMAARVKAAPRSPSARGSSSRPTAFRSPVPGRRRRSTGCPILPGLRARMIVAG